jgi:hypothetical protein
MHRRRYLDKSRLNLPKTLCMSSWVDSLVHDTSLGLFIGCFGGVGKKYRVTIGDDHQTARFNQRLNQFDCKRWKTNPVQVYHDLDTLSNSFHIYTE